MGKRGIVKGLLGAYVVTIVLLLLLAFLLFKFDLSENMVAAGITISYIISCFLGGIIVGKSAKQQKFLWGAVVGIAYFLLLIGVSLILDRENGINLSASITTFALCLGGGMLGGMLA